MLTNSLTYVLTDERHLTINVATGLISSLFDVTSSRDVTVGCTMYASRTYFCPPLCSSSYVI